jgi:hypothetical protein
LLVQPLPLMTGAGAPPRTVRPRRRIVKKLAFRLDAERSPQGLHAFLEWTPYLYEGPYTVQQCSRRLAVIFIVLRAIKGDLPCGPGPAYSRVMREVVAKRIIEMALRGVFNRRERLSPTPVCEYLTAEKGCLRGPETREGRDLFGE